MLRRDLLKGIAAGALAAPFISTRALAAPVELNVVHAWPGHDKFHQAIADQFMAANPEIKIVFQTSPASYEDAHQLILRQAMTNALPDIYYSGFHLLAPMARTLKSRNLFVPLDPFIAAEGAEWKAKNYANRILALGEVDGQQAGMAFNTSTPIVYFNEELVKQAGGNPDAFPTNWDDFLALTSKIAGLGADIDGFYMGIHSGTDDWFFQAMIYQYGGNLMDAADAKVAFGDNSGTEAFKLLRRFVVDGKMKLGDDQQSRQQFLAGKMGVLFQSTANLKSTELGVGKTFTLRTTRYPMADKQKGGLPTGGNAVTMLTRDAAKQKAAWEFIKWVTGPQGQKEAVLASGYMPANQRVMEKEFLGEFYAASPNWRTSLDQIPVARKWYGYPGTNSVKIARGQKEIIGRVMRGEIAPDVGLTQTVELTESLLPKLP